MLNQFTEKNLPGPEGAAIPFLEHVCVMPQGVRASQLNVHEPVRWIPLGDFRAPADGKTVNGDSVINQDAGTQYDRRWREDFKLQTGRREGLQVARLGEEGEDFAARARNAGFGFEDKLFDGGARSKPGFDAAGAHHAPTSQRLEPDEYPRRQQPGPQPEGNREAKTRPNEQHQRAESADKAALGVDVGREERFHRFTFLSGLRKLSRAEESSERSFTCIAPIFFKTSW